MHSSSTVALREELRTRSKTLRVQQNSWGASRTWKTTRSIWVDPVIHRDESRVLLHDLRREMYPFLLQAKAQVFEEYHFYPSNSSKEPKRHPVYFSHRLVLCSSELHMRECVIFLEHTRTLRRTVSKFHHTVSHVVNFTLYVRLWSRRRYTREQRFTTYQKLLARKAFRWGRSPQIQFTPKIRHHCICLIHNNIIINHVR